VGKDASKEEIMDFWKAPPIFFMPLHGASLKKGKDLFDYQISHLANALIVDDYDAKVDIDTCLVNAATPFVFPKDALISGSFVMHHVAKHIGHIDLMFDDIDIYFKNKDDAKEFLTLNGVHPTHFSGFDGPMCSYGYMEGHKMNLIYGVEYDNPAHLIERFDIRACSMAIDPNTMTLYTVKGAIEDATQKNITFNPVPRGVSVRRLTKYIKKGFSIDGYQSVYFVELCRSDIYSQELELMTKEY
jgi:hypothetical protein